MTIHLNEKLLNYEYIKDLCHANRQLYIIDLAAE